VTTTDPASGGSHDEPPGAAAADPQPEPPELSAGPPTFDDQIVMAPRPSRGPVIAASAASAVFVITLAVLFVWPIPRHIRFSPGPSPDVATLISVEGVTRDPPQSHLGIALVIVAPADNLFEVARAKLDSDSELFLREAVIPAGTSDAQNDQENAQLQLTSQQVATVVGLRQLGFDVKATGNGARITRVFPNTPADGTLITGDVITSIDGQPVMTNNDAVHILTGHKPGDAVTLAIDREGMPVEVHLVTAAAPDDPNRAIVGVGLETKDAGYTTPTNLTVTIDAGSIGGPSAGLIYTLGIVDALTPGDLTGGNNIAATGAMELDGTVTEVGGVREKTIGVEAAGARYFLVPASEAPDAEKVARSMKVVPVHNIGEALDFLKTLRGGSDLGAPIGR
jgi:PDZ domain-containing protein